MKTTIWIASVAAALVFTAMGLMKLLTPADDLASMSQGVPVELLRVAGLAEFLGGLGLILPAATRIAPKLTPIAAAGLALTMAGAAVTNIIIGSFATLPLPLALLMVAGLIGWARATRFAVSPRHASAAAKPATA
jgi:uncharacterized membrane protein YphA (DoxX/SURF4 family)